MRSLAIAILLSAGLAAPAFAQAGYGARDQANTRMMNQEAFNQGLNRTNLDREQSAYRDTQNPRRVRRAEEAAQLINDGDCAGALALAQRENDQRLLARITQVCSTVSVAAPAAGGETHN